MSALLYFLKAIYGFLTQMVGSWNDFVIAQPEQLRSQAQAFVKLFTSQGYLFSFLLLLFWGIAGSLFYYFVTNRKPGFYFRRRYWWTHLGVSAFLSAIITFLVLKYGILGEYTIFKVNGYYIAMGFANFLYTGLLFIVVSFIVTRLFKRYTNASETIF
ncbi:MAG: hypothetical protein LIP01_00275 [Tannerellaceae bacterium]|nr:hypothetical protein [Tannerellaceae bacterium]